MTSDLPTDLEARLVAMIEEEITFGEPVRADTDLLLSGLVDSVGVLRIVAWLEDELDIRIDPVDVVIDNFRSVELMVAYVRRR